MPSGQTSTISNRLPLYTGDSIVVDKVYATGGIDMSGAGVTGGAASAIVGAKRNIISGATTLTAAQSGSLCLFNAAAGYTFTLPVIATANIGMEFEFLWTITNTSVATKIITGQATDLIWGDVSTFVDATTPGANPGPKAFPFATDKVAFTCGGSDTTAGGLAGTRVVLTAVALLRWAIRGTVYAAGTIVTPAATS